jgi:hypothetical protein
MKRYILVFFFSIMIACSSNNNSRQQADNTNKKTTTKADSYQQQPEITVLEFLKWYRANMAALGKIKMVNNNGNATYDSTKFYSVNFEGTEKYLMGLKQSGFISEIYINQWRQYFKKCDAAFKKEPQNDGPPAGFDFDFVMCSQDFDEDLAHLEKAKIINEQINNNKSILTIVFPTTLKLRYWLTSDKGKWLIDNIQDVAGD